MIIKNNLVIVDRLRMGESTGYMDQLGINYGDACGPKVIRAHRNGLTDPSVSPGVVIMETLVDYPKRKPEK